MPLSLLSQFATFDNRVRGLEVNPFLRPFVAVGLFTEAIGMTSGHRSGAISRVGQSFIFHQTYPPGDWTPAFVVVNAAVARYHSASGDSGGISFVTQMVNNQPHPSILGIVIGSLGNESIISTSHEIDRRLGLRR